MMTYKQIIALENNFLSSAEFKKIKESLLVKDTLKVGEGLVYDLYKISFKYVEGRKKYIFIGVEKEARV